jgi:predicted RNase H-like HicB family nuclease
VKIRDIVRLLEEDGWYIVAKMRYLVVIERAEHNLSAYVPDLPGCVATGRDRRGLLEAIQGAIEMHLEGMAEDGQAIPEPKAEVEFVEARG